MSGGMPTKCEMLCNQNMSCGSVFEKMSAIVILGVLTKNNKSCGQNVLYLYVQQQNPPKIASHLV